MKTSIKTALLLGMALLLVACTTSSQIASVKDPAARQCKCFVVLAATTDLLYRKMIEGAVASKIRAHGARAIEGVQLVLVLPDDQEQRRQAMKAITDSGCETILSINLSSAHKDRAYLANQNVMVPVTSQKYLVNIELADLRADKITWTAQLAVSNHSINPLSDGYAEMIESASRAVVDKLIEDKLL